jgi:NadR type nicotinamide-nucleotide adenylyltransferase
MIKVAITGPESSGKTTLCQSLADHFNVGYIPEFARTYLEKTDGKYTQSNLDEMAQGQLKSILSVLHSITICDSDFSVLEIWSKYKYGNVSDLINEFVKKNIFDLHILCSPDIPWEEDTQRENPNDRDELFELYKASLEIHDKHFIVVSGSHKKRLKESLKNIVVLQKK